MKRFFSFPVATALILVASCGGVIADHDDGQAPPPPPVCAGSGKIYDSCSSDCDCMSGSCKRGAMCPDQICVCTKDSDCAPGERCVPTIDCHPTCK